MQPDLANLPDDARLSKGDMTSLLELVKKKYEEKIHYLEERIRLLQGELYGRKSEKRYPEDNRQLPIFGPLDDMGSKTEPEPVDDTIAIAAHERRKLGYKPLPENLPRVKVIHDLAEEEKMYACGTPLSRIGQDICGKLDYIPAKVRVRHHIRYKYACKGCEGVGDDGPTVKIAPAPVQPIEKSTATAGLLAHIADPWCSSFDACEKLQSHRGGNFGHRRCCRVARTCHRWFIESRGDGIDAGRGRHVAVRPAVRKNDGRIDDRHFVIG
jgi:transposase